MLWAKNDRLAGNTYLVNKNTSNVKQRFSADNYGNHITLGRSGGQTVDTRSIFRLPWQTLGCNSSS